MFIPVNGQNLPTFSAWIPAHNAIQSLYPLIPYHVEKPSYDRVIQVLLDHYSLFKQDPFLKSCFWAKMADFEFRNGDFQDFLKISDWVVQKGFPSGSLYKQRGIALVQSGRYEEAKLSFLAGSRLNPLQTPPPELLQWLDQKNSSQNKPGG